MMSLAIHLLLVALGKRNVFLLSHYNTIAIHKAQAVVSHSLFKNIFSGRTEHRPPTPDPRPRAAGSTRSHPPS